MVIGTRGTGEPDAGAISTALGRRSLHLREALDRAKVPVTDPFARQLVLAAQASSCAGTTRARSSPDIRGFWIGARLLIAARGLLAAGMRDTVRDLLVTFGRF